MKFKDFFIEALTQQQLKIIDVAAKKRIKTLDFGPIFNNERTYFEFKGKISDIKPSGNMEAFLAMELGKYDNLDYRKGLVWSSENPNKKLKLGGLIQQIDPSLLPEFNNRLKGGIKENIKMMIVISHKPEDIGGMSTDRRWTSCIAFGHEEDFLIKDKIKNGDMVAYLIKENDRNIENPLGRIAIRREIGVIDNSIFRFTADEYCYGINVDGFYEAVKNILEKSNNITQKNIKQGFEPVTRMD